MPIHDQTASVVNLAKSWKLTLERAALNTTIPTATLELLLDTLIALGTPQVAQDTSDAAARTVMGRVAAISEAQRNG
jgi:hypothetical protein